MSTKKTHLGMRERVMYEVAGSEDEIRAFKAALAAAAIRHGFILRHL
jgi:hypothetical protein